MRRLFAATLFLSAFLLFMIQPLTGRLVLPVLGGSAAVWTTCLVFFQAVLLAAYGWAHVSSMLPLRFQVIAQLGLLAGVWWLLPANVARVEIPDEPSIGGLVRLLVVLVGLPSFAVAVNSSLLQRWYAYRQAPGAADPYFLYAFSNAGSFAGLMAYPLAIEPWLALTHQRWLWGIGCGTLAVLVALCGLPLLRRPEFRRGRARAAAAPQVTAALRVRWFALSLVPASLLAGVTAYLSTELLPLPLLWVVPLGLYLLTFVTSFGGRVLRLDHPAVAMLPVAAVPLIVWHLSGAAPPFWALLALHLIVFVLVAALCHGRLADSRPPATRLTSFYWWLAAGGVAGGSINALVAPAVFNTAAEYPLMLVAAGAILTTWRRQPRVFVAVFAALASLFVLWILRSTSPDPTAAMLPLMLALGSRALWLEMRVAAACVLIAIGARFLFRTEPHQVRATRSVFAALRVVDEWHPGIRGLIHGSTVHGLQAMDPDRRQDPRSYFTRSGPVGQLIAAMAPRLAGTHVGVVGLGAGELAAYAGEGQRWTFYEIDPQVVRIAMDPSMFTYVSDAAGDVRIVLGDGRRSIVTDAGSGRLQLLVLDAFSSDSIPVHLLTIEAFRSYASRLRADGVIAIHISNRFVDLRPVLAAAARELGFAAFSQFDPGGDPARGERYPSQWVVMGRADALPDAVRSSQLWRALALGADRALWTDERATLLSVVR